MSSLIITKQTGNFFSLVLDGGDPIISEQNRLTTIGNYCNFKTANGANLILKQNILYSEITIEAYTPTSINDLWLTLITAGFFDGLGTGSGGTGAERFTELLDTFTSYIGRDGQVLVVNESMQRIETVAVSLFTDAEKAKLEGIETNAEVNIQADWNETDPTNDAFILNKPPIFATTVLSLRFAGLGQTYTIPDNSVAFKAWINDGVQHKEQTGFESDLNTFTQTGAIVTFKKTITTNQRIIIDYYL